LGEKVKINNQDLGLCRAHADRLIRLVPALVLGLFAFGHVAAETVFEEIIVTAQKRQQNIMDVPIAVTAITGAEIEASGIKDIFDLQQNVPGLIVGQSQNTTTSNFAIRGIGSTSNNFGVESSVGLYVDGVYRSRQSSMINDLVDVEAVEVLRGPQGTLFGKNTPSGAIQIRTVRPSQGTDAFIDLTAGDLGLAKLSAAANIPLTDNIVFRGTLFSSQRDGYVDDVRFGNDVLNDRDRIGGRLQLAYNELNDDLNWRLIVDYAEIDEICCVSVQNADSLFSYASVADPINAVAGSDAALVAFGGTVFTDFPYPQPLIDAFAPLPGTIVTGAGFEDYQTALNALPRSTNEDAGLSFEINKTLGNGMTLTSISAFRSFDTFDFIDADFTDVDILSRINIAEQESFSQEFRLAGEFGEGSNFVVGAYYFGQEIKSFADTTGGLFLGPYLLAVTPDLQLIIDGINAFSVATGGAFPPAANPFPTGTFAEDTVVQDHDGWAAFGQVDFAISDAVTVTLGARYTDETKDIDARYVQNAQGPLPDLDAIGLNLFLASIGQPFDPLVFLPVMLPNDGWGSYSFPPLSPRPDVNATVNDDQVTGTAKLSWFVNDSSMFYLSYSTGFKSGGTNTDRINPSFNQIFGPETSESIELGFKGDIGPVRLSFAYYDTQYEDFQANSFTGTGFNLQNAGDVDTNGFEVEVLWLPLDGLEIQAFYAHSEGDYKTFVGGTCRDATVFHTLMPDPGSGGDPTAEVCDRSGDPIPYNPEDRTFVAVTQNFDIGANTNMYVRAEYSYYSDQFTDGDLDPLTFQDDVSILNLRVGFNFDAWNSSLTLWGRNITDERYYHGSHDRPIQLGINSYPSEPSTFGLTFRKNFD
jgi:outer membrane receptor protein involved in Fe transport